jgi:hypothetical protein
MSGDWIFNQLPFRIIWMTCVQELVWLRHDVIIMKGHKYGVLVERSLLTKQMEYSTSVLVMSRCVW